MEVRKKEDSIERRLRIGLPSDTWPDRFLEWLKAEGF